MHIIWFKRDLRIRDHAPLMKAIERARATSTGVLPFFIVEPSVLHHADYDPHHWTFTRECLLELREMLASRGQPLVVRTGEAVEVLETLRQAHPISGLWAHEETGNGLTFARDKAVRRWARAHHIPFTEIPQTGAVRGLHDRDQWARLWEIRMTQPLLSTPTHIPGVPDIDMGNIPSHQELGLQPAPVESLQPGGETVAWKTLESFLYQRGANYTRAMSSPLTAENECSRISPYLAFGSLSMKQVVYVARRRAREIEMMPLEAQQESGNWARALRSFEERLHWRDHFVQKLETEPEIEFENFVRAYDGLRGFDETRYAAWAEGQTGYPMIDACMRSLAATRWINFRMRAMLVSFTSYDLWLDWREPSLLLARLFLDYEPGIHYSQIQMQSATTGINSIRVYNPTKQGMDQDPEGVFIRRWVPELGGVPTSFIHQPWLMPTDMQKMVGCRIGRDYPAPIVDHATASTEAKARLYAVRRQAHAQEEADAVQAKHGSRKRPTNRRPARKRQPTRQLRMF